MTEADEAPRPWTAVKDYMAAIEHKDAGKLTHHWTIGSDGNDTVGVEVWWNRGPKRHQESLVIRQDNGDKRADCVMITLGQVYDLIDALNKAVDKG